MSDSLSVRADFEELREMTSATLTANYQAMGYASVPGTPVRFANPVKTLFIQNTTNRPIKISFDGVTDQIALDAGQSFSIDVSANRSNPGTDLEINNDRFVWVKHLGVAPAAGTYVWVTSVYSY